MVKLKNLSKIFQIFLHNPRIPIYSLFSWTKFSLYLSINSKNAIPNPDPTHYFIASFVSKSLEICPSQKGGLDSVIYYEKGRKFPDFQSTC